MKAHPSQRQPHESPSAPLNPQERTHYHRRLHTQRSAATRNPSTGHPMKARSAISSRIDGIPSTLGNPLRPIKAGFMKPAPHKSARNASLALGTPVKLHPAPIFQAPTAQDPPRPCKRVPPLPTASTGHWIPPRAVTEPPGPRFQAPGRLGCSLYPYGQAPYTHLSFAGARRSRFPHESAFFQLVFYFPSTDAAAYPITCPMRTPLPRPVACSRRFGDPP